ncbi:tryptophan synthase subunit alpha [Lederbergia lenta]|uniref:Tryptophan synthase alpha chain n=1 Tax=Lederbergia lenta TaxID=1467 RepID=A0A2X4VSL2_LEDLE|nr:tryptophan synthase subunit alpha [Lederbergia lenta]MCM3112306.1 tryptophan synthase subunit alpha [Lederbergia lenta]MEC2326526.1 tryptophan synthase subunit alpha [Lederbergia lenta]SQI53229.1 tryptophan synthase subunit alpha [Lederbergia lenta]
MGKQKLDAAFSAVKNNGDKAFVPYIMAGDGGVDALKEQILFLQESGATAVELGIPFSDPVADGPVIQEAGLRALANGTTLSGILQSLDEWKESRTIPIVLMTYFNLIFAYGIEKFAKRCEEVGVDGLIIPDLPLEEEELVTPVFTDQKIALIRLVSPTSPKSRIERIAKKTEGFLYAVTVKGTTGARTQYEEGLSAYLQELQAFSAAPVLAGFGVSSPEQVKELGASCDGVIVGSKIVELLAAGKREQIKELIAASKLNKATVDYIS